MEVSSSRVCASTTALTLPLVIETLADCDPTPLAAGGCESAPGRVGLRPRYDAGRAAETLRRGGPRDFPKPRYDGTR